VLKRLADEINEPPETSRACPVVISGLAEAEKAAARLGVELRELPV
jgi:hypothetical protein